MSSVIYAVPHSCKKVRYNREVQEDVAEWQEREVDIYESVSAGDDQTHEAGPNTEKLPAAQTNPFRAAALCLGGLCFLMITAIILLSAHYISVSLDKDQLQTRYDKLSNNLSQTQENMSDMSANNSRLQRSYEQLQDQVKQLKSRTEGKWCPEGWRRFGCSCYFKSSEKKSWFESRHDCKNRRADLVIINSEEEQKFVRELSLSGESWIGLLETSGWFWVDGSKLTQTFRIRGQPYQYAACCSQQGRWTQNRYIDNKYWICEK